jgi:hypothetical protein
MNLTYDLITQKSLYQNVFPSQADREKGFCQADWVGTGATVTEPSVALGSTDAVSVGHICANPAILMTFRAAALASGHIYLADSTSGDGYVLTFPTVSSVTQITLSRLDAGTPTSLGTYDMAITAGATDKLDIALIVSSGAVIVKLGAQVIIQVADTTYRDTDWHLIVGGTTFYFSAFHYLTLHATQATYNRTFLEVNQWASNATKVDGYITLAKNWDCWWIYRMFPRSGFVIQVNTTPPANHESMWGLVTPDKSGGIYLIFKEVTIGATTVYWRLCDALAITDSDYINTALETSHVHDTDFQIGIKTTIYGKTLSSGTTISKTSGYGSYLDSGLFLHTADITGSGSLQIDSIQLSPDDATYGFQIFTAREVGWMSQPVADLQGGDQGAFNPIL